MLPDWFLRLGRRIRHFREDRDLQDELHSHLELLTADHLASGLAADEARRRARFQLGSPQIVVERIRDREFLTVLEGWSRDFLLGLRALRKTPVFCFTAIVTLALGIGANTAIFTLLYGLLLRSLPVPDAHRLAQISMISTASNAQRTGEIGVRIALGARQTRVLWMILADALRLVGVGVLAGVAALFAAVRFVREMLYGVSAFDTRTWIGTVAVLALVALAAALVPALRAASVDPIDALRAE